MMRRINYFVMLTVLIFAACKSEINHKQFAKVTLDESKELVKLLSIESENQGTLPRSLTEDGDIEWIRKNFDWTEGFFPGTLWYMYMFTGDDSFKESAQKFQALFESHKYFTNNHDLGFVFNNSFGHGYRITGDSAYKNVLIQAAKSLSTRFNPEVGCLQSWDVDGGWQAKRDWQFPVIIDNMMNLELLFEASALTKDAKYKEIAISHAMTTMKNHFRDDNSSFHVIDYDSISGAVRKKETAQGYSHGSRWARGQAWGLYGYTLCYRYTKDQAFLDQAVKIAEFIINNPDIPQDKIPYWDYNAPGIPNEPRDVSAATVTASALLELSTYTKGKYKAYACDILNVLATEDYKAVAGENGNFILKHSVGSIPHNAEIDVPLSYADYYFIEALIRLRSSSEHS